MNCVLNEKIMLKIVIFNRYNQVFLGNFLPFLITPYQVYTPKNVGLSACCFVDVVISSFCCVVYFILIYWAFFEKLASFRVSGLFTKIDFDILFTSYQESVAGSAIQAFGKVEFEDWLWIGDQLMGWMTCRGSTLYLGF